MRLAARHNALHSCNKALDAMREVAKPGVSENEVWGGYACRKYPPRRRMDRNAFARRRTANEPWFQESSSRPMCAGELLSFDTDLIGAFGICVDISR